jgi:hypothetical protein
LDTLNQSIITQFLLLTSIGFFSACIVMGAMYKRRERKKLQIFFKPPPLDLDYKDWP